MKKLPTIGITMGDPGGIGPEIILKLLSQKSFFPANILIIGDLSHLKTTAYQYHIDILLTAIKHPKDANPKDHKHIHVIDHKNVSPCLKPGAPSLESGKASAEYIQKAVELAMKKAIDAIVTCPISKEAINMAGFRYAGHTEMLAHLTQTDNFAMMLASNRLRVVLLTTHLPVTKISENISKEKVLRIIRLIHHKLTQWLHHKPKIGVSALNPHAGDGGLFGHEEIDSIIPAIKCAQKEEINVKGPYPADSLFSENIRKEFDVIIVMYHDQGLIPIKMAAFGKAVNITLGLPFIRTSVDHGTAYNIAGKGCANPSSLEEAVRSAINFTQHKNNTS